MRIAVISPGSGEDRRDQVRIDVILPGLDEDKRDQLRIDVILPGSTALVEDRCDPAEIT